MDHGRAPATRKVAGAVRLGSKRKPNAMKKLFVVALLSLAAVGFSVAPASAGWFHHHKHAHVGACATQYNAFSPYCVQGVYTSRHCHKCNHPAEGPCCHQPLCTDFADCGISCGNVSATGPATTAHGNGATLGVLPAPVAPSPQLAVPLAPVPLPAIPGATSQVTPPASLIQPLVSQP